MRTACPYSLAPLGTVAARPAGALRCMVRVLLLLMLLLSGWPADAASAPAEPQHTEHGLRDATKEKHRGEAVLTDGQDAYRLCTTRPQRLLPSTGHYSQRTPGRASWQQTYHNPLNHCFADGRCRLETAPFATHASCDYYVIALRHIIR